MTREHGDIAIGVSSVALAAIYWALAARIPHSLLADAVGAEGFPNILAVALAVSGALLTLRALRRTAGSSEPIDWRAHARAAVLMAILFAYVILTPVIGYPVAVALLIGSVAVYAGTRGVRQLLITSVAAGLLFWLAFAKLLGIAMPTDIWTGGG